MILYKWHCIRVIKNNSCICNNTSNMLEKGTMEKRQRSETAIMPLYILSLLSRHFLTTSLGLVRNKAACFQKLLHSTIWVFPKILVPQMDGLYWKTLLKWMIWGENPLYSETSIYCNRNCNRNCTETATALHLYCSCSCGSAVAVTDTLILYWYSQFGASFWACFGHKPLIRSKNYGEQNRMIGPGW